MATVPVLNSNGETTGTLELSDGVFARQGNLHTVHLAVVAELANRRVGTHDTKRRGEVRGGGRKPWRQKGTGRARHGSIRSPIWVGGGVAHGPHPRDYTLRLPRKQKRVALMLALSSRLAEGALTAMESLDLPVPKTREAVALLQRLGLREAKTLILLDSPNETLRRAMNNLGNVRIRISPALAVTDVLWADRILGTTTALKRLEENLSR